ncbi:MAG: signal peptidase I [Acidobacteria bacterium]|nr:signal peptidase I [Acidobacteriota bacterium]
MEEIERPALDSGGEIPLSRQDLGPKSGLLPDLRSWMRDILVSLGIAGVVIVFLYQPVKVEGNSMMPELADQERIFINKFIYRFESIERGDVVVFWYPLDPGKSYIKRVVGLPGETVQLINGEVYVNGRRLIEPYVPSEYRDRQSLRLMRIPPGEFFVLGDHRTSSNDSRVWGTVERRLIYGKAVFIYWPFGQLGMLR